MKKNELLFEIVDNKVCFFNLCQLTFLYLLKK